MVILIIEDEPLAAERLALLVSRRFPDAEIEGPLDTVTSAVDRFRDGASPDLVFLDVQLADGISFEIFDRVEVNSPIIFTTAYDEYALKAFKVNSVDYLLKPVDEEELDAAVARYRSRYGHVPQAGAEGGNQDERAPRQLDPPDLAALHAALAALGKRYKSRFVVREGDHLRTIDIAGTAYFYSRLKGTWLVETSGRKHLVEQTLEQLESLLDPGRFFRINRKFIVSLEAAADIVAWSNSRLKVVLRHPAEEDAVVARDRVKAFKSWLAGENPT